MCFGNISPSQSHFHKVKLHFGRSKTSPQAGMVLVCTHLHINLTKHQLILETDAAGWKVYGGKQKRKIVRNL